MVSVFSNMLYSKIRKLGNAGNHQKALQIRKHPLLTFFSSRTSKTPFKLYYYVYIDKFEEYFASRTMKTQNGWKSPVNNSVNLKN